MLSRLASKLFCVASLMVSLVACGGTKFEPWDLEELTDDEGFSLRVPEFELAPGEESQNCFFVNVPDINNGEDFFVSRVHLGLNPGSHHMNVFRVKTILELRPEDGVPTKLGKYDATLVEGHDDFENNPCWDSANWADWPLVANSQNSDVGEPFTDWVLPDNVGIRMTPGDRLMVQTHYVNVGPQVTPYGAKVAINFHKFQGTGAPMEMGSLFATQQSIRICQSTPDATFTGTCRFPDGGNITIEAANGHFHSRGKSFSVFAWDGASTEQPGEDARFYTSNEWDHPPMARNLDVAAPSGGGVWWNCSYKWIPPVADTCDDVNAKDPLHQDDCCYVFGGNVDVGEHCNLFLYYYPRVNNTDVFCN